MTLDELRLDIAKEQKKGIPFIAASIILWGLIAIVTILQIPIKSKNILVFCCACPLMPLAMIFGKIVKVDLFSKKNPLSNAGLLFTMNQMLYILIVMWVFSAVPEKMVMVFAMVFGAHLLPYAWLYLSKAYIIFAVAIPVISLIFGVIFNATVVALAVCLCEVVFLLILVYEVKKL
ncbi:hypothetical protein SAMN04487831_105220 [Pseudobutyrivibrio sp. UC1225]|uniref:DUF7010 family protein n=1 Tax=Pseudobutyrivibrio sp. UC1225 TaxID=1798185 RepID=UPI0008DF9DBB|nr:hypothetical protein [Pseudobutyrivibrio sp. UC1225]SFN97750.1 hypothetical protein SAMN04487831_105220 [Pseudobutyrivibrio sp. UC1225]